MALVVEHTNDVPDAISDQVASVEVQYEQGNRQMAAILCTNPTPRPVRVIHHDLVNSLVLADVVFPPAVPGQQSIAMTGYRWDKDKANKIATVESEAFFAD